jgi:uncharacterized protein YbaR (Trm112 family)/ubiquinone/menaquinone biosynthesis C-methylase UbiE
MDVELLALICCPFDHGNLTMRTFVEEHDTQIKEGVVICDCCGRQYPIASGIPRMLPLHLLPLADLEAFETLHPMEMEAIRKSHKKSSNQENSESVEWNAAEMRFWQKEYGNGLATPATRDEFKVFEAPFKRRTWVERLRPRERVIFSHLREHVRANSVVVEIGCGKTITVSNLWNPEKHRIRYIGTDLSENALKISQKYMKGDFVQCSGEWLPFRHESVDVLLCLGVLHHIPGHEDNIPNLLKLLKPKAYFVMHEVTKREKAFSRFKWSENLLPEESEHEEDVEYGKAMAYVKAQCYIEKEVKEYSALMTWVMIPFGFVLSRSRLAIDVAGIIDRAVIYTLGKIIPFLNFGSVLLVAQKKDS